MINLNTVPIKDLVAMHKRHSIHKFCIHLQPEIAGIWHLYSLLPSEATLLVLTGKLGKTEGWQMTTLKEVTGPNINLQVF